MSTEDFGELDDIGFLREAELFREMPDSVIRTIVSQGGTARYQAGGVVCQKGDPGDSLFVVKSGVVEIANPGEGPPLAYLGRGDCFGFRLARGPSSQGAEPRSGQGASRAGQTQRSGVGQGRRSGRRK